MKFIYYVIIYQAKILKWAVIYKFWTIALILFVILTIFQLLYPLAFFLILLDWLPYQC